MQGRLFLLCTKAHAGPGHSRQALAPAPWKKAAWLGYCCSATGSLIHGTGDTVILWNRLKCNSFWTVLWFVSCCAGCPNNRYFFLRQGLSPVPPNSLKLAMWQRMTSKFWTFWLYLLNVSITGMHYHILFVQCWGINPGALCMLGKYSTYWGTWPGLIIKLLLFFISLIVFKASVKFTEVMLACLLNSLSATATC